MKKSKAMKILFTLSVLVISLNNICAQWSNTANQFYDSLHMPVCTEVGVQENPVVLQSFPDGGYFVIWEDRRDGFYSKTKIYAQKYDNKGKRLWAANGVPVSAGTNNQHYTYASNVDYRNYSVAATDSAGGFYMCYADDSVSNYVWERVMVQHVRNNGNVVFPDAGYIRFTSTTANLHVAPQLIADGNKGFFIGFIHNVSQATNVYVDCFKDENGAMKYYGGDLMNQNVILVNNPPCNNHTVLYPGTTVADYKIYPDLQKGCNVVMSMAQNAGGNDRTFTGYNWLWRVKKDSRVGGSATFYPKDSVIKFYEVVIRTEYPFQCGNAIYTEYFLESNGFLQVSNLAYGVEKSKGTVVATDGNINANIIAVNERGYINNSVTDWFTRILYRPQQKFDSIPYQYTKSPYKPLTYIGGPPPGQDTLSGNNGTSNDTLLYKPGASYFYDFSLASGSNKIFAAAIMGLPVREVLLQQMQVQKTSSGSFEVQLNTSSKNGIVIGKEVSTGFSGSNISFDNPQVAADNKGNGLFYIREYYRSARISPIINGTELAWGAMGKPVGTGAFNNSYYNFEQPFVALDRSGGRGLISWRDNRNLPGSTGENIFMRHLDSIDVAGYVPPNKPVKLIPNPYGATAANPVVLSGSSKKYSTIEVYGSYGSNPGTSPLVEILDNYNLGNVAVSVYQNTGAIRTYNGKPYLDRNYSITPENNPPSGGAATINIRLFFTDAEFDALKVADPSITSPGDLAVIKQDAAGSAPASYIFVAGEQTVFPQSWAAVDGGYYIEIEVTSFSRFFIMKSTGTLPVTWLGIQAQWVNSSQAKVSWQVAQQVNVKEYTVQHSVNGTAYTDVCTAAASTQTQYSCLVPAVSGNKNYYRIMEQDKDGKINYSMAVTISSNTQTSVSLYPNPVKEKLYIKGGTEFNHYQITEITGRTIRAGKISSNTLSIETNDLPSGHYLLRLNGSGKTFTLKFIKE